MSQVSRELLLTVAHAYVCIGCRERLFRETERTLSKRKLTEGERKAIGNLTSESFNSPIKLAQAVGITTDDLFHIMEDPRCRFRHF